MCAFGLGGDRFFILNTENIFTFVCGGKVIIESCV